MKKWTAQFNTPTGTTTLSFDAGPSVPDAIARAKSLGGNGWKLDEKSVVRAGSTPAEPVAEQPKKEAPDASVDGKSEHAKR